MFKSTSAAKKLSARGRRLFENARPKRLEAASSDSERSEWLQIAKISFNAMSEKDRDQFLGSDAITKHGYRAYKLPDKRKSRKTLRESYSHTPEEEECETAVALFRGCTESVDRKEPFPSWNFTAPAPFDNNKSHPFEKKMPLKEKLADLLPKRLAHVTNPVEESQEVGKKALFVVEAKNTFSLPDSSLKLICEEAMIPEASPKNLSVEEELSYRASFPQVVTGLVERLENSLTSGTGRPVAPHHSTRDATDEFFDGDHNVAAPDTSPPPLPISRSVRSAQGTGAPMAASGNQNPVIRICRGQHVIEIHF